MKTFTALAILSVSLMGVGCSNAEEPGEQASDATGVQTVSVDDSDVGSQFNLSLPGLEAEPGQASGGYNLNLGAGASDQGGLMIGSGGFGGGDFGSDGDLDLGISLEDSATGDPLSYLPPASAAPEEADDIIRLPE